MRTEKTTVCVGLSGGVDSSVAAALLQKQGYRVIGVFIRTWQPDWLPCSWEEERRDALRVCAHLDIPFVELDLSEAYKQGVADYMIEEYAQGRTPNPDVMCNKEVKFGAFLAWARAHGADFVATGHYADIIDGCLTRGVDTGKDQSYFLWTLSPEQMQHILFPLGRLTKAAVRKKAEHFGLATATKKDSQGICFLGPVDMKEFLAHYIPEKPGMVHNLSGERIGEHRGVLLYTLGERHGFHIDPQHKGSSDRPLYVVAKDLPNNILIVDPDPSVLVSQEGEIVLSSVVDTQGVLKEGALFQAQIRYHGEPYDLEIQEYDPVLATARIRLMQLKDPVAQGQSIVIYDQNRCLGGGIVL